MTPSVRRRGFLAAVGAAAMAGCLGDDGGSVTTGGTDTTPSGPPTAPAQLPLPKSPAQLSEAAVSGGPSKDGIPSIDDPKFVAARDGPADLAADDPVFGVVIGGEAKAYSQKILAYHEICNDVVGGRPVSVTYCPLTGTAIGFERGETTFGVSGRLVNNNLIMYDRATETWWPQVLSTAIPGPWNESPEPTSLRHVPVVWTTWQRWRAAYPDTRLLSRETGFARNYESDPYGSYNPREGYYEPSAQPMFRAFSEDDRLPPKAVVLGTRTSNGAAAVGKRHLREMGLVTGELGEVPILAVYDPLLDTGHFYQNPEERAFEYRDGTIDDQDGGSYEPDTLPLEPLLAFDAMWFAWVGFYPDTTLYV